MRLLLIRTTESEKQTTGELHVYGPEGRRVFSCATLELPWRGNKRRVSRIPEGLYTVVRRHTPKFGDHLHLEKVQGRTWILVHAGNFHTDTSGCILVGRDFADLNRDGEPDVIQSRATMKQLMRHIGDGEHVLRVVDVI